MTRRNLALNVAGVAAGLLSLVVLALLWGRFHTVLKDFAAFFLAIAAAYLGYCFQRRQAFLVSLRDLWHQCIDAKADIIDCTRASERDAAQLAKAQRSISVAIDKMRAVYRNVGETEARIGLFPFEPLHDMRKALDALAQGADTEDQRAQCQATVMDAWNAFRWAFLREFGAPYPTNPITERNKRDPRRSAQD